MVALPESKACNALVAEAQPEFALYSAAARAIGSVGHEHVLSAVLEGFRDFYGGLWVGGKVELTSTRLSFSPNVLNQLAHKGDYSWSIPLPEIQALSHEFGFLSGIICIETPRGRAKLRCFGAKGFLARIAEQQKTARYAPQHAGEA